MAITLVAVGVVLVIFTLYVLIDAINVAHERATRKRWCKCRPPPPSLLNLPERPRPARARPPRRRPRRLPRLRPAGAAGMDTTPPDSSFALDVPSYRRQNHLDPSSGR